MKIKWKKLEEVHKQGKVADGFYLFKPRYNSLKIKWQMYFVAVGQGYSEGVECLLPAKGFWAKLDIKE
jgi:hypothetical protein